MHRDSCDICGKEVYDNEILCLFHVIKDGIFMFLLVLKIFGWICWQSQKLGVLKNFPCTCGHKASWHLVDFVVKDFPTTNFSWFYLLFCYKLTRNATKSLGECFKCIFSFKKPPHQKCFEFEPLNNLIYLENLYKKK